MLDDVLEAFQILNIGEETQDNIFRLLSLILAVSSIEYEDTELDGKNFLAVVFLKLLDMSLRVI
jgi:myosin heavy subunit